MKPLDKEAFENIVTNIKRLEGFRSDAEVARWLGRPANYISQQRKRLTLDMNYLLAKCEEKGWRFEDLKSKPGTQSSNHQTTVKQTDPGIELMVENAMLKGRLKALEDAYFKLVDAVGDSLRGSK